MLQGTLAQSLGITVVTLNRLCRRQLGLRAGMRATFYAPSPCAPARPRLNGHDRALRDGLYAGRRYTDDPRDPPVRAPLRLGPEAPNASLMGCGTAMMRAL